MQNREKQSETCSGSSVGVRWAQTPAYRTLERKWSDCGDCPGIATSLCSWDPGRGGCQPKGHALLAGLNGYHEDSGVEVGALGVFPKTSLNSVGTPFPYTGCLRMEADPPQSQPSPLPPGMASEWKWLSSERTDLTSA